MVAESIPSPLDNFPPSNSSPSSPPHPLHSFFPPTPPGSSFLSSLSNNPVFSAGAGIAGLGVAAAGLRRVSVIARDFAQRHFTVSLEIPSKDPSYQWLLQHLSKQQASSTTSRSIATSSNHTDNSSSSSQPSSSLSLYGRFATFLSQSSSQHVGLETEYLTHQDGSASASFSYIPSPGIHSFYYKGRLIKVEREREKSVIDMTSGTPWETVTLTTIGRNRNIFTYLLQEAKLAALKSVEGKTIIYISSGNDWRKFGLARKKRPIESVVLEDGVKEKLLGDMREFTKSQSWYVERGIPYRRGYLLYGPPGCGKSSFIVALAGELSYNICVLNLNDRSLTDEKLSYLLSTAPPRSILLLEDIDAAFTQRHAPTPHSHVTFSGLLNAIDGVASTEERVVYMTTNHIHKLDPALIRPGRVDIQIYIGLAKKSQIFLLFKRFYPQATIEEGERFVNGLTGVELSIAELQGYFLLYKENSNMAIDHLNELKDMKREQKERERVKREKEIEVRLQEQLELEEKKEKQKANEP